MVKILLILTLVLSIGIVGWMFYPKLTQTSIIQPQIKHKDLKIGILSQKNNKTYESSISKMKEKLQSLEYEITYLQDDITENTQFTSAAKKLVEEKVDVIVTNSTPATKAAMGATSTIPIVFGSVGDPVENGVVKSLDSSGNNVTGISSLNTELAAKRLNLLMEVFPNYKTVYLIHQEGEIASDNSRLKIEAAAKQLNVNLLEKSGTNSAELKVIASELKAKDAQAILMSSSGMVWTNVPTLIEVQNREKIPLIGVDSSMAEQGTVISYGPDYMVIGDQLGSLVDQVLKGVNPQYLPIQRPNKIQLIINKKAARSIGLTIPESILSKANKIIE
jgi:putative tryptophan/tyrosine transport system substrate-binding protein